MTLDFSAVDVGLAGLKSVWADLDGVPVTNGLAIDLYVLGLGNHTLTVHAVDKAGNESMATATFTVGDIDPPTITITSPVDGDAYYHPDSLTLSFSAVDVGVAGLKEVTADLDGMPVTNGQIIDLYTLALGDHTLTVKAVDMVGNTGTKSVTFLVTATLTSLKAGVDRFYQEGEIDTLGIYDSLMAKLNAIQPSAESRGKQNSAANVLEAFINEVTAQSGKHITTAAADLLIADAQWILANPPITQ